MDRERYQVVSRWFEVLSELSGDELAAKLKELQEEDGEVQAMVRDLLKFNPKNTGFLEINETLEATLALDIGQTTNAPPLTLHH